MKKESLVSSRDSLKDRAMTLWNRLSCPDEEAEEFNREPQNVLRDDIRKVQACRPEIMVPKEEGEGQLH